MKNMEFFNKDAYPYTNKLYCIAGKFGEFGESSAIHQTKTIQISTYN